MTIRRILNKAGWLFESLSWLFIAHIYKRLLRVRPPVGITLGITTFKDRFASCLKPFVSKLAILFPAEQIVIVANGHYLTVDQKAYMDNLKSFCGRFANVEVESFSHPQGLSVLWNTIVKRANYENIFILNDDIRITARFRRFIKHSGIIGSPMATINSSWSHFKISKEIINKVGLFDEHFKEIGGEDDDYAVRIALAGIDISNFRSGTIVRRKVNKKERNNLNSYGKKMSDQIAGYSDVNSEYLASKWLFSNTYFEDAVKVPGRNYKYWKLRSQDKLS